MKKIFSILLASTICLQLFLPGIAIAKDLRGYILLQVDSKGESWYVSKIDGKRYLLGTPAEVVVILKKLSLGVKHTTIQNPPARLIGHILLDVEDSGKAYYYNPRDKKLYYLGRPGEVLTVLSKVGLGISNNVLASIPQAITTGQEQVVINKYIQLEKKVQELVSDEREKNGLSRLRWNDEVAAVAREHSQDQARENLKLVNQSKYCSFPFIHHEGMVFGLYHSDRLYTRNLYYQAASAENIALIPKIKSVSFEGDVFSSVDCQAELLRLNNNYKKDVAATKVAVEKVARLKQELVDREKMLSESESIQLIEKFYNTDAEIEEKAVTGWMNSPGHRQNILHAEYDEAGIGIAEVNGYFIITQVFIKRAECGFKGGACCKKTNYLPYCYVPWNCDDLSVCR